MFWGIVLEREITGKFILKAQDKWIKGSLLDL